MQKHPDDAPSDTPHGDSGGTRTPAGTTYGDFHPTYRHERGDEPFDDEDKPVPPPDPQTIRPPTTLG